jgi:hypothetical protein
MTGRWFVVKEIGVAHSSTFSLSERDLRTHRRHRTQAVTTTEGRRGTRIALLPVSGGMSMVEVQQPVLEGVAKCAGRFFGFLSD